MGAPLLKRGRGRLSDTQFGRQRTHRRHKPSVAAQDGSDCMEDVGGNRPVTPPEKDWESAGSGIDLEPVVKRQHSGAQPILWNGRRFRVDADLIRGQRDPGALDLEILGHLGLRPSLRSSVWRTRTG